MKWSKCEQGWNVLDYGGCIVAQYCIVYNETVYLPKILFIQKGGLPSQLSPQNPYDFFLSIRYIKPDRLFIKGFVQSFQEA